MTATVNQLIDDWVLAPASVPDPKVLDELVLDRRDLTLIGDLNPSNAINPWTATYWQSGCKRILIDSGRKLGLLRQDIDLQPKRGFTLPLDIWLKGPLQDILEDTLSSARIRQRGWLDDKVLNEVKNRFLDGHLGWVHPWLLIILELWWQEVVESQ